MKDRIIIPKHECLICHYVMDSTTGAFEDGLPNKGDLSVCDNCGTVTQFDDNLNMVPLTEEEIEELKEKWPTEYTQMRRVQKVIHQTNKQN